MMKLRTPLLSALAIGLLATSFSAQAEGDWKKGRIYYRMTCTACHAAQGLEAIAPIGRTKAEWTAYLAADKHAKGKDSVKYFVSKKYRESVKGSNKAAAKYIDDSDAALMEDVRAFIIRSAKDGEVPASCN